MTISRSPDSQSHCRKMNVLSTAIGGFRDVVVYVCTAGLHILYLDRLARLGVYVVGSLLPASWVHGSSSKALGDDKGVKEVRMPRLDQSFAKSKLSPRVDSEYGVPTYESVDADEDDVKTFDRPEIEEIDDRQRQDGKTYEPEPEPNRAPARYEEATESSGSAVNQVGEGESAARPTTEKEAEPGGDAGPLIEPAEYEQGRSMSECKEDLTPQSAQVQQHNAAEEDSSNVTTLLEPAVYESAIQVEAAPGARARDIVDVDAQASRLESCSLFDPAEDELLPRDQDSGVGEDMVGGWHDAAPEASTMQEEPAMDAVASEPGGDREDELLVGNDTPGGDQKAPQQVLDNDMEGQARPDVRVVEPAEYEILAGEQDASRGGTGPEPFAGQQQEESTADATSCASEEEEALTAQQGPVQPVLIGVRSELHATGNNKMEEARDVESPVDQQGQDMDPSIHKRSASNNNLWLHSQRLQKAARVAPLATTRHLSPFSDAFHTAEPHENLGPILVSTTACAFSLTALVSRLDNPAFSPSLGNRKPLGDALEKRPEAVVDGGREPQDQDGDTRAVSIHSNDTEDTDSDRVLEEVASDNGGCEQPARRPEDVDAIVDHAPHKERSVDDIVDALAVMKQETDSVADPDSSFYSSSDEEMATLSDSNLLPVLHQRQMSVVLYTA